MKSHEIKQGSGPWANAEYQEQAGTEQQQGNSDCPSSGGLVGLIKDVAVGTGLLALFGVFCSCRAVTNRILVNRDSAEERNPMLKEEE